MYGSKYILIAYPEWPSTVRLSLKAACQRGQSPYRSQEVQKTTLTNGRDFP